MKKEVAKFLLDIAKLLVGGIADVKLTTINLKELDTYFVPIIVSNVLFH